MNFSHFNDMILCQFIWIINEAFVKAEKSFYIWTSRTKISKNAKYQHFMILFDNKMTTNRLNKIFEFPVLKLLYWRNIKSTGEIVQVL